MGLDSVLRGVESQNKQFTVYRRGETPDVEARFATHAVDVVHRTLPPGGPAPFLVIQEDDEFAGAISLSELETLLDPPIVRPEERADVSRGYRVLFDVLDEAVFVAMERRQLLAVSREIEERAFRAGSGTLHVGLQTLSKFESQLGVYRRLAAETELDIHIHGILDWTPPEIAGVTYHEDADATLQRYWVLAFDGGADPMHACGLLARERPDGYRGFWTDDPELVGDVLRELETA
jgi:hypothetical protein